MWSGSRGHNITFRSVRLIFEFVTHNGSFDVRQSFPSTVNNALPLSHLILFSRFFVTNHFPRFSRTLFPSHMLSFGMGTN